MNVQAAIKTVALVLVIGAWVGAGQWGRTYALSDSQRAQRDLTKCLKDGRAAAYRENPLLMGRKADERDQRVQAECRRQSVQESAPRLGE